MELKVIERDEYLSFALSNKYISIYQLPEWGDLKAGTDWNSHLLGLYDSNNLVGATLLLEKKGPMNQSLFYAPRGFLIDVNNSELLTKFTNEIKKYVKKHHGFMLKVDPNVIYATYDENGNNKNIVGEKSLNNFKNLKYKHYGFTKNFETMQPRYTFRIDLEQSLEEIEEHFSKTTKQRIAKAEKLDTEVTIGNKSDIHEFYHLMTLTESRKDFISYNEDYYETLYEIFNGNASSKATLFLGKINFNKTIKALEKNLKDINNQISILPIDNLSKSAKAKLNELTKQKDNIVKDIEKYTECKKDYGNELTLSAHMIIEYGDKAWVLYAGNHNILSETYVNYSTYFEHIKYCKEKGIKIYDQFGTIGDLSKDNPRLGLHEFKKKFGGDYIEFIGEWDYITNPLMYFVFTKLVPIYRKLIRNRSKKELKNELKNEK